MYAFLLSLSLLAKESRTPFMQTGMCSRGCAMGLTDILHLSLIHIYAYQASYDVSYEKAE